MQRYEIKKERGFLSNFRLISFDLFNLALNVLIKGFTFVYIIHPSCKSIELVTLIKWKFLHVKYRKSGTEDRRYKVWQTGSAGGANNSSLDANQMHMLTERALCTMGRNNFVLIKG